MPGTRPPAGSGTPSAPDRHRGQTDPALLTSCFRRSLEIAAGLPARSVALPAVSAEVYGWDVGEFARIAVTAAAAFAATPDADPLELIRFVPFGMPPPLPLKPPLPWEPLGLIKRVFDTAELPIMAAATREASVELSAADLEFDSAGSAGDLVDAAREAQGRRRSSDPVVRSLQASPRIESAEP